MHRSTQSKFHSEGESGSSGGNGGSSGEVFGTTGELWAARVCVALLATPGGELNTFGVLVDGRVAASLGSQVQPDGDGALPETAGDFISGSLEVFSDTGGGTGSKDSSSEWALRDLQCNMITDFSFHASHESGSEWFPLRAQSKIVVESLVLEEHVLIGPVRSHKLSIHVDLADELLGTAQLNGPVHGINTV